MPSRLPWVTAMVPALALMVSACADDGGPGSQGARRSPEVAGTTVAAAPWSGRRHVPACTAGDLVVRVRPEGDGAGGHSITLVDLRNVSASPCRLTGHPRRVALAGPGRRDVTASDGSFFPAERARGPVGPGEVRTLGIETDASCPARPTGGPPGPYSREVRISLPHGVVAVTFPWPGLDVGCGAHLTPYAVWR